ncbi:MAG: hypothetical protein AAGF88_03750 [Pseudomonadota bacterium]
MSIFAKVAPVIVGACLGYVGGVFTPYLQGKVDQFFVHSNWNGEWNVVGCFRQDGGAMATTSFTATIWQAGNTASGEFRVEDDEVAAEETLLPEGYIQQATINAGELSGRWEGSHSRSPNSGRIQLHMADDNASFSGYLHSETYDNRANWIAVREGEPACPAN